MLKSKGNKAFQNTFHLKQPYNNVIIIMIIIIYYYYFYYYHHLRYLQSKTNKVDGGKIANC